LVLALTQERGPPPSRHGRLRPAHLAQRLPRLGGGDGEIALSLAGPRQLLNQFTTLFGVRSAALASVLSQPVIGWIFAIEACRPALDANAIRRLATTFTQHEKRANGRTGYSLRAPGEPFPLHGTFDRGYLIHRSDRALIGRAIATRSGGFPFVHSGPLRQQLPAGGGLHNSGATPAP